MARRASSRRARTYDKDLRDTENIPLTEDINAYMKREVLPHVPDAWVNVDVKDDKDGQPGKVGYEINFNRYFYVYKAPRAPHVIADEIGDGKAVRGADEGGAGMNWPTTRLRYVADLNPGIRADLCST